MVRANRSPLVAAAARSRHFACQPGQLVSLIPRLTLLETKVADAQKASVSSVGIASGMLGHISRRPSMSSDCSGVYRTSSELSLSEWVYGAKPLADC